MNGSEYLKLIPFLIACAVMIFMGFREKRRYLRDEELKRQHGHSD